MKTINLISCAGVYGQLGLEGRIPWVDSSAYHYQVENATKQFVGLVAGKFVIIGARTWENFSEVERFNLGQLADMVFVHDGGGFDSAQGVLRQCAAHDPDMDIWVIGGGKTFHDFTPLADSHTVFQIPYVGPADTYLSPPCAHWQVRERAGHGLINTVEPVETLPLGGAVLVRHGVPIWMGRVQDMPKAEFSVRGTTLYVNSESHKSITAGVRARAEGETQQ